MSKKQQQGNTGKSVETLAEYRIRTAGQDARWVQLQREVSEGEQYTKGLLASSKASNAEAERDIANMKRVILSEQKKAAAIERDNEQLDRDIATSKAVVAAVKLYDTYLDALEKYTEENVADEIVGEVYDGLLEVKTKGLTEHQVLGLIAQVQSCLPKGCWPSGNHSNDDYHTSYSASTSPNASTGTKTGSGSGSDSKFSNNSSSGSSDDEKPGSCHVPSKVVTTKGSHNKSSIYCGSDGWFTSAAATATSFERSHGKFGSSAS